MNLILLQNNWQFLEKSDSKSNLLFLLVLAGFIAVLIIASIIRNRRGRGSDPNQKQKQNSSVFRRMAKEVGLQKHHVELLEYLVRVCKVKQPFLIFSNAGLLDDILRKGVYSLEQSRDIPDDIREKRMSTIFQIKQMIERNARRGIGVRSTNLLRPGQSLVISLEGEGDFDSKVVSNMRDLLACRTPRSASGQELRWRRGTRLRALFWRENDAGYTFQTKVLGYDTIKGIRSVLIQHSKTLRREQQRRFRRSPIHRSCFYYPINIVAVKEHRRTVRKAVVQNQQRRLGNLLDVSAGGCSVSGMRPLKPGNLLRIEFEINKTQRITVFGKVRRVRNQTNQGGIMHIMFTKLSSRMLNQIYSYVYDYTPSLRSLLKR